MALPGLSRSHPGAHYHDSDRVPGDELLELLLQLDPSSTIPVPRRHLPPEAGLVGVEQPPHPSTPERDAPSDRIPKFTCQHCRLAFPDLRTMRAHYQSDLHRFNLILARHGRELVTPEQFQRQLERYRAQQALAQQEAESGAESASIGYTFQQKRPKRKKKKKKHRSPHRIQLGPHGSGSGVATGGLLGPLTFAEARELQDTGVLPGGLEVLPPAPDLDLLLHAIPMTQRLVALVQGVPGTGIPPGAGLMPTTTTPAPPGPGPGPEVGSSAEAGSADEALPAESTDSGHSVASMASLASGMSLSLIHAHLSGRPSLLDRLQLDEAQVSRLALDELRRLALTPFLDEYDSLFDARRFQTVRTVLATMYMDYGFRIPYPERCTDPVGYLRHYHACLLLETRCPFCRRTFRQLRSVRRHILDRAHATPNLDSVEAVVEWAPFYDYGPQLLGTPDEADAEAESGGSGSDDGGEPVSLSSATIGRRHPLASGPFRTLFDAYAGPSALFRQTRALPRDLRPSQPHALRLAPEFGPQRGPEPTVAIVGGRVLVSKHARVPTQRYRIPRSAARSRDPPPLTLKPARPSFGRSDVLPGTAGPPEGERYRQLALGPHGREALASYTRGGGAVPPEEDELEALIRAGRRLVRQQARARTQHLAREDEAQNKRIKPKGLVRPHG